MKKEYNIEKLSSDRKAYFIGFMSGDGAFLDGRGKRTDRMGLTTTDVDVVNWVNKHIQQFDTKKPYFGNNPNRGIFAKLPSYRITFPTKFIGFFNKYGICCKKIDRSIFNISKKDMKMFILGLIDSDGCISYSIRKDRNRICAKVNITHPSNELLGKVQTFISDELNISSTIKPKGREDCLVWSINKIEHIEKLLDWLYSDEESVVLARKYKKYIELKEVISEKREAGLCFPSEFTKKCSEYISLMSSMSKKMFCIDGVEYPSKKMASDSTGMTLVEVSSRCRQRNKGCSERLKTESELKDNKKYVKKQMVKLYKEWEENR